MSKLEGRVSMKVLNVVMMCVCAILAGCKQKKADAWPEVELSMGFRTIQAATFRRNANGKLEDIYERFSSRSLGLRLPMRNLAAEGLCLG